MKNRLIVHVEKEFLLELWKSMELAKLSAVPARCKMSDDRQKLFLALVFFMLVCGAEAKFPCSPEQIHWNSTEGNKYKCLNCPDCPAGSQPSVPCGVSVKYGTPVHCVLCELGKTYSAKYSKAQCEACKVCSEGKSVVKNCTLSSNTECSSRCKEGYYFFDLVFSCFECSKCCDDGNDERVPECAYQEKKCKVRSKPCAKVSSTESSQPATTRQPSPAQLVTRMPQSTHYSNSPLSTEGETRTLTARDVTGSSSSNNSQNLESKTRQDGKNGVLLGVAVVLMAAVFVVSLVALFMWKFICRARPVTLDLANNRDEDAAQNQVAEPGCSASVQQPNDHMTLRDLEENYQDVFDSMCTMLDNGRLGPRRDFERLASKYSDISLEIRRSLQNEFQSGGSPSRLLMSYLQTLYPGLTLGQFVNTVKDIGRNDVARYLLNVLQQNN